jgi:integrase
MNHLEKHEVLAVLKVAREHSELDWLLFSIQYIHSHRISEVLSLTPENFDLTADGGFCTVQRLKGSLKTTQPLVSHDNPLLNELPAVTKLLATVGPKERLFGTLKKQNANYRFAKYATLAGLPKHKRHTHCLRHSRAMHTIRQAGIENVRQLCGHASIASTGYYLRVSDQTAWAALGAAAGL